MSTTTINTTTFIHPTLSTLTDLLNSTFRAGYHLRQDIGLYIFDQKHFTKLLKERAKSLTRDFADLRSSENADDHRAIQVRIMPALSALEREAEVHLGALTELATIGRALEETEDELMGRVDSVGLQDEDAQGFGHGEGDSGLGNGTEGAVARPPLVIQGAENLDVAISDAMRDYRINNGLIDQEENGRADSAVGSSDESGEVSAPPQPTIPRLPW